MPLPPSDADGEASPVEVPARLRGGWILALAVAVGAAVRLEGWRQVFTADGVRMLFDSDPLYHLLQARRLLANGFSPTWFDRQLSWPVGGPVIWPPLWDLAIAGTARLLHGPGATVAQLEAVGAILPVLVGLATLPVVALGAARLLGPGRGPWAAMLVAGLGGHAWFTYVGRPDQHAPELLLAAWITVAYAAAVTSGSRRAQGVATLAMGVGVGLAFWNWMGSAIDLLVPLGAGALGHLLLDRSAARRLLVPAAAGLGLGSLLLAGSVAAWGPAGALGRGELVGLSGLHVALCLAGATFAAALLACGSVAPLAGRWRRLAEVVLAAALVAGATLAGAPWLRAGVVHGLTALFAGSAWHDQIAEYRPLLFSCEGPLTGDAVTLLAMYGLVFVVDALALPALHRRWRRPAERPRLLILATWLGAFLVLALARRRFAGYLVLPAAIAGAEGLLAAAEAVARRLGPGRWRQALVAMGCVLVVGPSLLLGAGAVAQDDPEQIATALWLARQPIRPGQEGIATPWESGHLFLYYAGRPVVATPFGTDVGDDAMRFTSRLHLSPSPGEVEALLDGRRVGYLVTADPVYDASIDQGLGPPGTPPWVVQRCSVARGTEAQTDQGFQDLAVPRLFYRDGLTRPEAPAEPFTRLRLVQETAGLATSPSPATSLKIFQVVAGARVAVSGAPPEGLVQVTAAVRTSSGRSFTWSIGTLASPAGEAVFTVPYASGANGASSARLAVETARRVVPLSVTENDVLEGRRVDADLRGD